MEANQKTVLIGAACAFGGFVLGGLAFGGGSPAPAADPVAQTAADTAALEAPVIEPLPEAPAAAPAAPAPASDWRVDESTDPLTDETIKIACATSSNQVYLSSPYGPRSARLCIRQHPKFGRDVYLTLDGSGQILCRSYDNCTVPIRFDDGTVQSFSGGEPSDNSSETIFIVNDGRFITAAKAASRIRVQLEFYQNGNQTFDFPARGLEW